MIQIEPLFATDSFQIQSLLRYENESAPKESFEAQGGLLKNGLTFWQHWLPCRWHLFPDIYVAKEEGAILGFIALVSLGKARSSWLINHLVVQPEHRGRGIALELLRYIFALFGSQGVSHFVIEVISQNTAALTLLASCGFRRVARIVHYQFSDSSLASITENNPDKPSFFRLAISEDKQALYQLHQDALPADLRHIFALIPEDFAIVDLPYETSEKVLKRLLKRKFWYWVAEDKERKVLTAAIKVTAAQDSYHLEFAIHPGWTHLAKEAITYATAAIRKLGIKAPIVIRASEYQPAVIAAITEAKSGIVEELFLMTKEHWVRAKKPKFELDRSVGLPSIANPAINFPLQPGN